MLPGDDEGGCDDATQVLTQLGGLGGVVDGDIGLCRRRLEGGPHLLQQCVGLGALQEVASHDCERRHLRDRFHAQSSGYRLRQLPAKPRHRVIARNSADQHQLLHPLRIQGSHSQSDKPAGGRAM